MTNILVSLRVRIAMREPCFGRRVIDIFDDDGNGEVDFKEFIMGLSHFSAKGDMESKLRFAFRWAARTFKLSS